MHLVTCTSAPPASCAITLAGGDLRASACVAYTGVDPSVLKIRVAARCRCKTSNATIMSPATPTAINDRLWPLPFTSYFACVADCDSDKLLLECDVMLCPRPETLS